jgi:hypothetical protein
MVGSWYNRKEISRIPKRLQEIEYINRNMAKAQNASLARLFAYVSVPNEDPLRTENINETRRLNLDWITTPELMVPGGASRRIQGHSCASSLSAAVQAGFKPALPGPVTVDAAMAFVQQNNSALTLSVAEGEFHSPIHAYLFSPGVTDTHRLFGNLVVWDWYRRNNNALTTGGRYRTRMRGVAIVREFTGELDRNLTGNFTTGASLPIASFDAKIQGRYKQTQSTSEQVYTTAEYAAASEADSLSRINALPMPGEVINRVAHFWPAAQARLANPEEQLVIPFPLAQRWIVQGIPSALCSRAAWDVQSPATGYTRTEVKPVPVVPGSTEAQLPWSPCEFTVTYNHPAGQPTPGASIELSFSMRSIAGPGQQLAAVIGPFESTVNAQQSPRIQSAGDPDPMFHAEGPDGTNRLKLSWADLRLRVNEAGNATVDWGQVTVDSLDVRCGTDLFPLYARGQVLVGGYDPGQQQLSIRLSHTTIPSPGLDTSKIRQCHLSGGISLVVRRPGHPNLTVKQPLPAPTLYYPAAAPPPQALEPAPAPASAATTPPSH